MLSQAVTVADLSITSATAQVTTFTALTNQVLQLAAVVAERQARHCIPHRKVRLRAPCYFSMKVIRDSPAMSRKSVMDEMYT